MSEEESTTKKQRFAVLAGIAYLLAHIKLDVFEKACDKLHELHKPSLESLSNIEDFKNMMRKMPSNS